jgi:hypothetical protein
VLPLTTTSETGATYYLGNASFLVRDAQGVPVVTLSSEDEEPDAPTISADLDVGSYTVELLAGWALRRVVNGEPAVVAATLSSPAVVEVSIDEQDESTVLFEFVVGPDGTTGPQGSLGIGIAVQEGAVCGNGLVDEGESCDDGTGNGSPDRCDWTCAFTCSGACPLRVDPGASESGDGRSWESALVSVSAAIEQQFALGGGEVWVRGPGPYDRLAGDPRVTLVQLRERVSLIGGFSGTERVGWERDRDLQTTITGAVIVGEGPPVVPLIIGASRSRLEGFSISGQEGTALAYRNARAFNVVDFTISDSVYYDGNQIELTDSAGNFDRLRVVDSASTVGISGVRLERSHAAISNSEFARLSSSSGVAGVLAIDASTLVLDNVWFVDNRVGGQADTAGVRLVDSQALAVDSVWLRNLGYRPALGASNSRFVAVSSHWEGNNGEQSTAVFSGGGSASLVNCSFVNNRAPTGGIVVARGAPLEIVNSTFLNNDVTFTPGFYPEDIGVDSGGSLALYNSFSNRGENSVFEPYTGTGNCFADESAAVDVRTEPGYSEVYLTPELGCLDIGDANVAENAMLEASVFATSLGAYVPYETTWWQSTTSVLSFCPDTPPMDPGRHYFAPSCE